MTKTKYPENMYWVIYDSVTKKVISTGIGKNTHNKGLKSGMTLLHTFIKKTD